MSLTLTSLHEAAKDNGYSWIHFVARSSEEGLCWAGELLRHTDLMRWNGESLALLRRRRFEAGRELIGRIETGLRECVSSCPSIVYALQRWYFGLLAYYRYSLADFDGAERALDQAHEAVTKGIELRRFLVPLAYHCSDFAIQRIRVARSRRRWQEMRRHAELVRAMMAGQAPLCVLGDGTPISMATVTGFYAALAPLSDEERRGLEGLLDPDLRVGLTERFIADIYLLPGMVIPYEPAVKTGPALPAWRASREAGTQQSGSLASTARNAIPSDRAP